MDTIQINKFSKIHNGKTIIFCKTDYLLEEFDNIRTLPNDVILISGNSDYIIDDFLISKLPSNVIKWYAQNAMTVNEIIKCLPLGIENRYESLRPNHGIGYERVEVKEFEINNQIQTTPNKLIYSNFNTHTNLQERPIIRDICIKSDFIDWDEPTLDVSNFFKKILNYEAVVCPQGNGPGDNHRIYETLYMNRIPITFNEIMYNNLHHLFPVVLVQDYNELLDYEIMKNKINNSKNKTWDNSILDMNYWINLIKNGNN